MSRIEFEFVVAPDHPSLPGHFPGRAIVPGVLLLDHVFEALRRSTGLEVSRVVHARFSSALFPGEAARGWSDVDGSKASFHVTTIRSGSDVAISEGAVQLMTARDVARA